MAWNVDQAGETIPMARERIAEGAEKAGLNVTFSSQVTDHGASRRSTAMATAETPEQVVDVLRYVLEGKLPAGA